jgi:hypothetical protein
MIEVRPFARGDREQLSRLVNAHVAAATPGGSVPAAMNRPRFCRGSTLGSEPSQNLWRPQLPSVPGFNPSSRATCAIDLPVSRTSRTAPCCKS